MFFRKVFVQRLNTMAGIESSLMRFSLNLRKIYLITISLIE